MHSLKNLVYRIFEKIISVSDILLDQTTYMKRSFLRSCAARLFAFTGDVGWLLRDIFSLPAYEVKGKEWRMIFVGREASRNIIENLYFGNDDIQWEKIDQVFVLKKNQYIQKWIANGTDLIIFEVSRILPFAGGAEYKFQVPCLIRQVLTLPGSPEKMIAGGSMHAERKKIHRAERYGYSFRFSNSMDDFNLFYQDMYLPYVSKRHGRRAVPDSYESMLKKFKSGGLIQIVQGGQSVGAFLCRTNGETAYTTEYGKKDIETQDHTDITHLLYWNSILWAFKQGIKKMDFGASPAWCTNGIFHHKNCWKPKVRRFDPCHSAWQMYAANLSPRLLGKLNEIQFVTEVKRDFYRVILQTKESEISQLQCTQMAVEAQHDGLNGAIFLMPYSKSVLEQGIV